MHPSPHIAPPPSRHLKPASRLLHNVLAESAYTWLAQEAASAHLVQDLEISCGRMLLWCVQVAIHLLICHTLGHPATHAPAL